MAPASFDSYLLFLIENNQNLEKVKMLIAKHSLHKVVDINMDTLLHHAVKHGNQEVVQYLIDSGSKIDALDGRMRTPLMLAMNINSKITVIEALVKAGANIYVCSKKGQSLLQSIGQMESLSKKILLIFYEKLQTDFSTDIIEIAEQLTNARWPLTKVIQLEDAELTKIMLQRGYARMIDEHVGRSQKTALHVAVECGDVKNVKVLLDYNATINLVDSAIKPPLSYLYDKADNCREKLDILKLLLERTSQIDPKNVRNILQYGNAEAIKLLFKKNIEPMSAANYNENEFVVHVLAKNRNSGVMEQLKNQKFDIDARNYRQETPLITAAMYRNTKTVEFLLNMGADINATDVMGISALFYCILYGLGKEESARKNVQILLEYGANTQMELDDTQKTTIFDLITVDEFSSLHDLAFAHLSFQEARGTSITQNIRSKIDSNKFFKDSFESHKRKLGVKIYESTSLFDLLSMTDKKLERQMCNDDFVLKFKDFISSLSDSYYFSTILRKRISKAKECIILKREAACVISTIMKTKYERFPHIIDEIIDYLEHQEMRNLIKALS